MAGLDDLLKRGVISYSAVEKALNNAARATGAYRDPNRGLGQTLYDAASGAMMALPAGGVRGMPPEAAPAAAPTRLGTQFSLQRTNPDAQEMFGNREIHRYDIVNQNGDPAGKAQVLYDPNDPASVTLRSISSPGLQKNVIGNVGMRGLLTQFKQLYPEAETLNAQRATGAGQQTDTSRPMAVDISRY